MDAQSSSQENITKEERIQKQEGEREAFKSSEVINRIMEKVASLDIASTHSTDHYGVLGVEVDMKLYIGQEIYKRKQKIHNYEELLHLAQNIIKNHHSKVEGKIILKYVDIDKDHVNIFDQESFETAAEELQNNQQKQLKVFAEIILSSDSKLPYLSQSFSNQKGSTCSNCSSQNIHYLHNDSSINFDQLNQNISRSISQNINLVPLTASQFVHNENVNFMDEDNSIKDDRQGGFKGQILHNQILSPTNNSQNIINFANSQQTPTRITTNGQINESLKNQHNHSHSNESASLDSYQYDQSINNPLLYQQFQNLQVNQQKQNKSNQQSQPITSFQQQTIPSLPLPPTHQAVIMSPYDPQYQQFLIFKEYFQNLMITYPSSYFIQGQQMDYDGDGRKNSNNSTLNSARTNIINNLNNGRQSSIHSLQNQPGLEPISNYHRYSNSLNNYQANMNDLTINNDIQQNNSGMKRDQRVYTSLDDGIGQQKQNTLQQQQNEQTRLNNHQQNKSHYNNNNSNINHTTPPSKKNKDIQNHHNSQNQLNTFTDHFQNKLNKSSNVLFENNQKIENQIQQANNIGVFENKKDVLNDSCNKNQLSNTSEQEQINIDDLSSFKSQKIEDSNSLIKLRNQKMNNNQNINNSSDSDQTVKNISGLSNYYYNGFPNEIQQNLVSAQLQNGEVYQNISQVDCFSLSTSKEDRNIPSIIANNLYIFDSPQKKLSQRSPTKTQVVENQSRISQANDKLISKSVEQNVFQSEQLVDICQQLSRDNQYGFNDFIEQSIVIQKGTEDRNSHTSYLHTLKQIQKKTVDELKKDPNATECVQELLSNEKCKFCKKNLLCKYKDKYKLVLSVVNHKIKQILPYLRPLIENQIESKKNNHIRAYSHHLNEELQPQNCTKSIADNHKDSIISDQEEKVCNSEPIPQIDISFNQKDSSNSPQTQTLFKNLSSNQGSDNKQSENANLNVQQRSGLNDYTFQNLNDQLFFDGGSHRCSFGSNHRSPRHSVSFDDKSKDQINESFQNQQHVQQRLHSFNEFPDDSITMSNQFGSPQEIKFNNYPAENKQQPLYANFQSNPFNLSTSPQIQKQDGKQNRLFGESKQEKQQVDFFSQNKNQKLAVNQQNKLNNLFGNVPLTKKQSQNSAFIDKLKGEYYIYDGDNVSNDEEEESKDQKPDQKQFKPGSYSNLMKNSNEFQKHEQSQQYAIEFAEYSQNQIIDCYPGEKRDILIEVKNIGKKNWDQNNFYLKCIKGVYEKQKFPPTQKIVVGQDGQIHLQLKIPQEIKTYTTQWKMFETKTAKWSQENSFGNVVKIQFVVRQPPVSNHQFWQNVKDQLDQLVDRTDKEIDKKIHEFIKGQQILYNYKEISKAKQEELIGKIISSYFD